MPKMTVYVATSESGEYDDYRLKVRGVFASLEDAKAIFSQDPPEDAPDDGEAPTVWGEWEDSRENGSTGQWWTQKFGSWRSDESRTITQTEIGEKWEND